MTWFKVCDKFPTHRKARKAGKEGRLLWYVAGNLCARNDAGGVVTAEDLDLAGMLAEVDAAESALALVRSGLWHDQKAFTKCDTCKATGIKLDRDAFYFHDWLDYQFSEAEATDPLKKKRRLRNNALHKDRDEITFIRERDQDHCRYCGCLVDFGNRAGGRGGTYDHVDPNGRNDRSNVVVACRTCNGRKGHRTPEEAGMSLLPEPKPYQGGISA